LAVDGISMLLLFRDWRDFYDGIELPPLAAAAGYRQYILSKEEERNSVTRARSKDWWMSRIDAGLPPAPQIPLAQNPAATDMRRWSRYVSTTETAQYRQLKKIAQANGLSTTVTVLAAWCEILAMWGGGSAFTLNVTVADRPPFHPDSYQAIGNFTSNSLLAIDRRGLDTFIGRARKVQQQLYQDLDRREFSGLEVMREVARRGGSTHMPFTFNSTLEHAVNRADGTGQFGPALFGVSQTPQVWLNVFVVEQAGTLLVQLDAVDALFPAGMLEAMAATLQSILHALATHEDAWSGNHLAAIPPYQKTRRLATNDTASPIPATTLHEAFLAAAERHPERFAIRTSGRKMTYAELVARSAEIAVWIDRQDVKPGKLIAVVMPKGWEQIAAILGILRAGAAYLPIDPETPPARLAWLLKDAEAEQVLTTCPVLDRGTLPAEAAQRSLCVDQLSGLAQVSQWQTRSRPEDLAYVLYTSGTTGHPKGVMISHRSVINLITDVNARYGITRDDVVFGVSNIVFDLSIFDIFGTLSAGATLVLPDPDKAADAAHWLTLVSETGVTVWNSVPAIVRMLLDETT
ncbi:MAG: AMP-binding protein, partial [Rhodoferax sp.]|nr:AMP-binding protein [Pseudorhodobacter sp.]